MKKFLLILILFLVSAFGQWGEAATRYINSDSDGSALNPTRAFDHASYVANDSYATLSAAYTAASNDDVLEFSGGTGGKTYVTVASLSKRLTVQGSQIAGHKGTVTFQRGAQTRVMFFAIDGCVLNDLTLDGTLDAETNLRVNSGVNNCTVNRVKLINAGSYYFRAGLGTGHVINDLTIDATGNSAVNGIYFEAAEVEYTFNRAKVWYPYNASTTTSAFVIQGGTVTFNYSILSGNFRTVFVAAGTANFNNCTLKNNYAMRYLSVGNGAVANLKNLVL